MCRYYKAFPLPKKALLEGATLEFPNTVCSSHKFLQEKMQRVFLYHITTLNTTEKSSKIKWWANHLFTLKSLFPPTPASKISSRLPDCGRKFMDPGHVPRETELEFPHHAPHPPFTAEPWSMPTPSLHHPKCSTQTATIKKNLSMSVNSFIQFSQIVPFQRLSLQQICTEWLRYHTGKHRARHRRFSGGHNMVRFLLALTRLLAGNNEQVMKSVIATTQGG